jgi:hypothetical protein
MQRLTEGIGTRLRTRRTLVLTAAGLVFMVITFVAVSLAWPKLNSPTFDGMIQDSTCAATAVNLERECSVACVRKGAKWVRSRHRSELFYVNSDNRIMVVRYTANDHSFVPEKPRLWSAAPLFRPTNNALWNLDIAPDGRRFVVLAPPEAEIEEPATVHATILLNFFDELRRRVPST